MHSTSVNGFNYFITATDCHGEEHEYVWRLSYWRAQEVGVSKAIAERLADACPGYVHFKAERISDKVYFEGAEHANG